MKAAETYANVPINIGSGTKATQLQTLISEAKATIRAKYPD